MSKCIYKAMADSLDKEKLEEYYQTHLPKDVCEEFGFDPIYFYRIFDYLGIKRRTASENTKIQFQYYDQTERNAKVAKAMHERVLTEDHKRKISESQKGKVITEDQRKKISQTLKGNIPWNKGVTGVQKWSPERYELYYEWCRQKLPNTSYAEDKYYEYLKSVYDEKDIKRQYWCERYPFRCDFYIESEDLFIECNYFWHHGTHEFNPDDPNDVATLNEWQRLSNGQNQYAVAIDVWTRRDKLKFEYARKNNLNYIALYE